MEVIISKINDIFVPKLSLIMPLCSQFVFSYSEKCSAGNTDKNCCSSSNKCDENQGDCDNDSDCKSGLKCGTDNCPAGFPDKTYDCCYNPNGNNPITSTIFRDMYF